MDGIEVGAEGVDQGRRRSRAGGLRTARGGGGDLRLQRGEPLCGLMLEIGPLAVPDLVDPAQDAQEAWTAALVRGREVGAAKQRLQFWGQPDAHRPAAAAGGLLDEFHVHLIDVWALLAIDLDADEVLIHVGGDRRIAEALARHDMAPMAGRVAD